MKKLINKESVLEIAKGFTFTDKTQERQYMYFLEYCLDNAPTAYDLDKVVKELEEKYDSIPIQYECNYESGLEDGYAEAIEIVKRGVSNEID